MKNFYVIYNSAFINREFPYGEDRGKINTGQAEICSGCGSYISSLEWLPPVEITVNKKIGLGDAIFGTYVGMIISAKFKNEYEKTQLEGLSNFKNVSLFFKEKLLDAKYYYPKINLINAFVDLSRVEFEKRDFCDVCQKGKSIHKRIHGIHFLNPDKINSDIFFTTALGQADLICTEAFRHFVLENNFSNILFIKATDYNWDAYNGLIGSVPIIT